MKQDATCIVAGGGPAGLMCGYLLARAGVDVIVLEKHADFLRDFRGDTIHPSTLAVMHELGVLKDFLARPHEDVQHVEVDFDGRMMRVADFGTLRTPHPRLVFMPQYEFLDFLADEARKLTNFKLMMEAEATDLIEQDGRITGVQAQIAGAPRALRASLTIAADGRGSKLRDAAGFKVRDLGAPMDVLWFKLNHRPTDGHVVLGRVAQGQMLIMLYRGDYWQCALIIRKGGAEEVFAQGIEAFRARVAKQARRDNADEIASLDDVKLLTVRVDRLEDRWWKPGLLFIGDAAHAMSPIGGVGINLAIQDAIAASNILAGPLKCGAVRDADLARVQQRRMFPARVTQAMQVTVQNNLIDPLLAGAPLTRPPLPLRLLDGLPWLQRFPARFIGIGVRPEHVRTAAVRLAA